MVKYIYFMHLNCSIPKIVSEVNPQRIPISNGTPQLRPNLSRTRGGLLNEVPVY